MSAANCPLCPNQSHTPNDCKKKKGCANCGIAANHRPSSCKVAYKPYDKQLCDECLSNDHEVKDCKDFMGRACSICGHGDHTNTAKKSCALLGAKSVLDISDDILDQFTLSCRRAVKIRATTPAPAPKGSPAKGRTSPTSPTKAGSSSLAIRTGRDSAESGTPDDDEDPKAAQLRLWAAAEKELPHKKTEKTADGVSVAIKANFFEIKLDEKVKLVKYSIIIDQKLPGVTVASATPANPNDKRKIKRETKRFLINHYLTFGNRPSHNDWASDYDSIIISKGPLYADPSKLGRVHSSSNGRSSIVSATKTRSIHLGVGRRTC